MYRKQVTISQYIIFINDIIADFEVLLILLSFKSHRKCMVFDLALVTKRLIRITNGKKCTEIAKFL